MNVSLAVQTFSESVANSIDFLAKKNHTNFVDSEGTVKFIRDMNFLFDIFNSKHCGHNNIWKRPLCPENKRIVFDFFEATEKYFKTLEIKDEQYVKSAKNKKNVQVKMRRMLILKSRRKTGLLGFIINMKSLKLMYTEYVEENLPTYYLLQDDIEMFFGRIRSCCGYNSNPNVNQFKGAYRKVQHNMKIDISQHSNCRIFDSDLPPSIYHSNIYSVSSRPSRRATMKNQEELFEEQKNCILHEVATIESIKLCDYLLEGVSNYSIAHVASKIEESIENCSSFHCNSCLSVFNENEKIDMDDLNFLNRKPCISTFDICRNAEKFFKVYDVQKQQIQFDFKVIYCLIFRTIDLNALFPRSMFKCDIGHKYQFIKCIVERYLSIRATQVSKDITYDQYKHIFRQQLRHLVINSGQ